MTTTLPPELEGKLQAITCRVHNIELQQQIRDLVTEQEIEVEHYKSEVLGLDHERFELEKQVDELEAELEQMKSDRSFAEEMWMDMMP